VNIPEVRESNISTIFFSNNLFSSEHQYFAYRLC
jgi:hypothetical protein